MRQCYCGNEMRNRLFPFFVREYKCYISRLIGRVRKTVDYSWELRLASKEPEYAVFLSCISLYGSPALQGWER